MAESKVESGLRGVVAGTTALSSVGAEGDSLRFRGYDIENLVEHASFEEVAYLLLYGHLPTQAELDAYVKRLRGLRSLPA
ncbi:MAG TPA: citrate/2-methylcitrate synthase, partial [Lacipirellula sp.]